MTQKQILSEYMDTHDGITAAEAFYSLGISRLSARIKELKADGVNINTEQITGSNRYGKKVKYLRYRLVKE